MKQLRLVIGFLMILLIGSLTSCQQASPCTGEPTPEMSEFIDAWFTSWNAREQETLLDFYAEDALYLLSSVDIKIEGKEAIQKHITGVIEGNPGIRLDLKSVKIVGEHVFIFYNYSGTDNRTGMGAPPTGKTYKDCQVLTYFRTEEGKIKHQEFYFDDFYALKQLGYTLTPPAREEASME